MGAFNLAGLLEGLEGFSMALFTRILGRTPEEIQINLMDIRKMLKDPKIHTVRPRFMCNLGKKLTLPSSMTSMSSMVRNRNETSIRESGYRCI